MKRGKLEGIQPKKIKKIRVFLVFLGMALNLGCELGERVQIEQIDYENQKAIGVTFTAHMDLEKLRVFVGEESQTSVIGVIVSLKDKHQFTPVIPFSPGQTYTLRKKNTEVLASFTIPKRAKTEAAVVLAIHPKVDTVPENLLKMYFEFAQPMQAVGNALDFITVTNETDGTETKPFLRLESELWNQERTVLTLWLDPGRIKTDLIPNRERGLPLRAGKTYRVAIDPSWKSRQGAPLKQGYTKKFHVGMRDDWKPELEKWQLQQQEADSLKSLTVDFGEPMDAFLSLETIQFHDRNDRRIRGRLELLAHQSRLRFVPDSAWPGREIEIRVQSRLEDLAGNNLERRFDTPISDGKFRVADTAKIRSRKFKLQK